ARARAAKSPRWSVARRAFPFSLGTQASRTRRRAPVMARRSGCLAGTRAPVGAPHPLAGAEKEDVFRRTEPRRKEREEDEVGRRGNEQFVGWVERSETQHPGPVARCWVSREARARPNLRRVMRRAI